MGDIIIYNRIGEPIQARATITRADQSVKLNAEDIIDIEIGSPEPIMFEIGDYINYCGQTYTLNQLPSVTKKTESDFVYSAKFEGEMYELLDSAWLLPSNTYGDSFTGDLQDFLDILLENMQRSDKSWELGSYPTATEHKTLSFPQSNCLNVLQQLCKEYKLEFEILRNGETRILNLKTQVGAPFPTQFKYGRTGGAYKIERKAANQKNVITRLFVFGSDKNLPSTYRQNVLCLPDKERNESYISDPETTAFYGIKESVKKFDNIYPARYGKVTGINVDCTIFTDTTMDFDLNETEPNSPTTKWLIPGTTAKVVFNTGGLAGYTFEITKYTHAAKEFKLKYFVDANGLQFPNPASDAFKIKVGDEYFITDIRVPYSYVREAEQKLQVEGQKYFDENCRPHVNYTIALSALFLKKLYGDTKLDTTVFAVGDSISVYDFDLEISKSLRIAGFTRNLLNPYEFTITIAENVEVSSTTQRIISELTDIKKTVIVNNITATDNHRRNWLAMQEVLDGVFDPEGFYYSEKIKPLSIETTMLAVGARSQQFVLKNVIFETNYTGNPNTVRNTAGTLEHYTIAEPEIRVWQIRAGVADNLQSNSAYYIYAKCPKLETADTGIIIFSTDQITIESDPQFYHFLVGTLTSVITDVNGARPARNIALTYGASSINGRFINTGRIQSKNGSVYIDLDNNEVAGNFNFKDGLVSGDVLIGQNKTTATAGIHASGNTRLWVGGTKNNPTFAIYQNGNAKIGDLQITHNGTTSETRLDGKYWYIDNYGMLYIFPPDGRRAKLQGGRLEVGKSGVGNTAIEYGNITADGQITASDFQQKYNNRTFKVPALAWAGRIYFANDNYYNDKHGGTITISTSRANTGIVRVYFSPQFSNDNDYIITAMGEIANESTNGTAFVTLIEKTKAHAYFKVSDDDTTNDFNFHLQIWLI